MTKLPQRKPNRLKGYDYSRNCAYFITICAKNNECLFGKIVGAAICRLHTEPCPQIKLSAIGELISIAIENAPKIYPSVIIDNYVIMPNHVHMIIIIQHYDGRQIAAPTISTIVGNLKRYVTIKIGYSPWQKSFHDHIIRDNASHHKIIEYINSNFVKWKDDCFYV